MANLPSDDLLPMKTPANHCVKDHSVRSSKKKRSMKFFIVACFLFICGAVLSVIGVIGLLRQTARCKTRHSTGHPKQKYDPTTLCAYSSESRRIRLPEFLGEVKRVYYELRPEVIAWDSEFDDEKLAIRVKQRYHPYQTDPMKLKARTDKSLSLLAKLNSKVVDMDQLKPREMKTLEQLRHFLQHNFGVPYDDNYYNGDWLMGPNYFCWQPFCNIHIRLYSYSFCPPNSYQELQDVIERIMEHKITINRYRENMELGVKTGMVRSLEDCRSGVDALKDRSRKLSQANKVEAVLEEWYMAVFNAPVFYQNIVGNVSELWVKKNGKTPLESVQQALMSGFGQPMLDLINYMENVHVHHCVPSEISSGLSSLPLDWVYYDGKPTKQRTTKVLPTGERLDGRKTYKRILSYFTTTDMSADEIMKEGKQQQTIFYDQIKNIARSITGSQNTTDAVAQLKRYLSLDSQWYNEQDFPQNESDASAFKRCIDDESARVHCPVRYAALQRWIAACRETMARIHPQFIHAFHVTGNHVTLPSCPIDLQPHFNPSVGAMFFQGSDEECSESTTFKLPFFLSRYGPKFQQWSVVAHETRPGHHAQAQGTMEYFHSHCSGKMSWLDNLQSGFPAFTEGWALYSENPVMSNDTAIYHEDQIQKYGMFKWQLWRALRLIIDTGLHQRGLKRKDALKLFETYAWDKTDFARKELTRYQSCPGQATAYMIGRLTIVELRRKAEEELGTRFNLKDFHYQILSQGNAPLSFLRKHIGKYIDCVKQNSTSALCQIISAPAGVLNEMNRGPSSRAMNRALLKSLHKHYP